MNARSTSPFVSPTDYRLMIATVAMVAVAFIAVVVMTVLGYSLAPGVFTGTLLCLVAAIAVCVLFVRNRDQWVRDDTQPWSWFRIAGMTVLLVLMAGGALYLLTG